MSILMISNQVQQRNLVQVDLILGITTLPVDGTLTVNRKALSISGLTAIDKTYDGSDDASISSYGTLSGILFSDNVSLDSVGLGADSANFSDKDVAVDGSGNEIAKTVTLTLTNADLTGAKSGNYSITDQTTSNAKSTKRHHTTCG